MATSNGSDTEGDALPAVHGSSSEPMIAVLSGVANPEATGFADAWVGIEPTFSNRKTVGKWQTLARTHKGELLFFQDPYMLRMQERLAERAKKKYDRRLRKGDPDCMFASATVAEDEDPWGWTRKKVVFSWAQPGLANFEFRISLDPETFEYTIKPLPVAWLYEPRFVRFLQKFVWDVAQKLGLVPSIAHGGGQFAISAKTFLHGSVLVDDLAAKLNHPELANFVMDFPNPDDRSFRATRPRLEAFARIVEAYWDGRFHPRAIGVLTVEHALQDRGFGPAMDSRPDLMDPRRGPIGDEREVFQNNFAFGRAVRWLAQNIHPGYWQSAHPEADGYRLEQIMRYSEGNLNRLQIAGERHIKSFKLLNRKRVPPLAAQLEPSMLYSRAVWENRGQMSRASAEDFVEAVLLDVHSAMYLEEHPHVQVTRSLLQDQLMADAEEVLQRIAPDELGKLRREAAQFNLKESKGRIVSELVEPETLFWSVWEHLPSGEKAAIAREAVAGFIERVESAASKDPRGNGRDPMEAHRHRIHPTLWKALEGSPEVLNSDKPVRREWTAWQKGRLEYLARRPIWSPMETRPPWDEEE